METRTTYCRICEAACGLIAEVDGEQVVRLRPDPEHVSSRGFSCAKGVRFEAVHHDPDRLNRPHLRRGGQLEPVGWREAIGDAGRRLRELRERHGPHSVGVYVGNPAAFSFGTPLISFGLVRGLGTRNYFTAGSMDCNNKFVVARHMLGSPATHPLPDLNRASFALLIGTNPSVSQSSFVHAPRFLERLRAIEKRGGQVVVVDPRRTETARAAGQHLPIVPDTDAALLLSLLQVIFAEGLEHSRHLSCYSRGEAELRRAVEPFTPERVAQLTSIAAGKIRELARGFACADGAFCHVSTGLNQGRFGVLGYAAKVALEMATGNLDRAGGTLIPRGAVDTAGFARKLGLDREPRHRSRIGNHPPVLSAMPSGILADEILTPGAEQLRGLVVVAGNPLLSVAGGDRLRQALQALDTLVVIDLFKSDTGAYASHLLPATDWLERPDLPASQLQLQPEPYLQWTDAVVRPKGERRHDWKILADLARAAHVPLFGHRVLDRVARAAFALGGPEQLLLPALTPVLGPRPLNELRSHPHGLLLPEEPAGGFLDSRVGTPSGKVELCPPALFERLPELEAELDGPTGATTSDAVELLLFSKRERWSHNSWMHNNPRLERRPHQAWISPADAARLAITSGDLLELSSARDAGSVRIEAQVSDDIMPGACAVPHGYGHDELSGWRHAIEAGGANINELAPTGAAGVDPLSGMTPLNGVRVRARRVERSTADAAGAA